MGKATDTVLVIDGDARIRRTIAADLEPYGYLVSTAEGGGAGLNAAVHVRPALIILDSALPDMSGLEFVSVIRSWSDVPVIVLSSDTDERQKVDFLRGGADDYMTKPFGVAELAARCDALLRRARIAAAREPVVRTGPLTIDLVSRAVVVDGRQVTLTRKEYRLLHLLASHVGLVITHDQLIRGIWDNASSNSVQYLRTLMRKLRGKLEADPAQPKLLISESGVGYRLERGAALPSARGTGVSPCPQAQAAGEKGGSASSCGG
jgi:two-component system, OmpR family, KDP operon response regulator KdpE